MTQRIALADEVGSTRPTGREGHRHQGRAPTQPRGRVTLTNTLARQAERPAMEKPTVQRPPARRLVRASAQNTGAGIQVDAQNARHRLRTQEDLAKSPLLHRLFGKSLPASIVYVTKEQLRKLDKDKVLQAFLNSAFKNPIQFESLQALALSDQSLQQKNLASLIASTLGIEINPPAVLAVRRRINELVLAHDLRHIQQYARGQRADWSNGYMGDPLEQDAYLIAMTAFAISKTDGTFYDFIRTGYGASVRRWSNNRIAKNILAGNRQLAKLYYLWNRFQEELGRRNLSGNPDGLTNDVIEDIIASVLGQSSAPSVQSRT